MEKIKLFINSQFKKKSTKATKFSLLFNEILNTK